MTTTFGDPAPHQGRKTATASATALPPRFLKLMHVLVVVQALACVFASGCTGIVWALGGGGFYWLTLSLGLAGIGSASAAVQTLRPDLIDGLTEKFVGLLVTRVRPVG